MNISPDVNVRLREMRYGIGGAYGWYVLVRECAAPWIALPKPPRDGFTGGSQTSM